MMRCSGGSRLKKYLPHTAEEHFVERALSYLLVTEIRVMCYEPSGNDCFYIMIAFKSADAKLSATPKTENRSASEHGCLKDVPAFIYLQNYIPRELISRLHLYSPPPHGATAPSGPGPPYYPGFTITLKTHPLDRTTEDLYLTPHNTQESDIHAPDRIRSHTPITRLQTHAIERAATGIDEWPSYLMKIWSQVTAMYRSIGSPVSKVMWEATC
jgi:hypothetical protein